MEPATIDVVPTLPDGHPDQSGVFVKIHDDPEPCPVNPVPLTDESLRNLGYSYRAEEFDTIQTFLGEHADVVLLLPQIAKAGDRYFPGLGRRLEVSTSHEGEHNHVLFVVVDASGTGEEANDWLRRFDDEWWFDRSCHGICVSIEGV